MNLPIAGASDGRREPLRCPGGSASSWEEGPARKAAILPQGLTEHGHRLPLLFFVAFGRPRFEQRHGVAVAAGPLFGAEDRDVSAVPFVGTGRTVDGRHGGLPPGDRLAHESFVVVSGKRSSSGGDRPPSHPAEWPGGRWWAVPTRRERRRPERGWLSRPTRRMGRSG